MSSFRYDDNNQKSLVDCYLGMIIANLFYAEGINTSTIVNYSDEELKELLERPENLRSWTQIGVRFTSWSTFISLSKEILRTHDEMRIAPETAYAGSVILAFTALEEMVNSFIQDCLIARKMDESQITKALERRKMSEKLTDFLQELAGHSLQTDCPDLWETFKKTKEIRNNWVHNKLFLRSFVQNEPKDGSLDLKSLAFKFVESVEEIHSYLESIYPTQVLELNEELTTIWQTVKKRLNLNLDNLLTLKLKD